MILECPSRSQTRYTECKPTVTICRSPSGWTNWKAPRWCSKGCSWGDLGKTNLWWYRPEVL